MRKNVINPYQVAASHPLDASGAGAPTNIQFIDDVAVQVVITLGVTVTLTSFVSGKKVTVAGVDLVAGTDWSVSGNDAADATALAAAVNARTAALKATATAASNVVTIRASGTPVKPTVTSNDGSGVVADAATPVGTVAVEGSLDYIPAAEGVHYPVQPAYAGNWVELATDAVSGAGATIIDIPLTAVPFIRFHYTWTSGDGGAVVTVCGKEA